MNAFTNEIDTLANQIYNYYRDLGSSRNTLTKNDTFKVFNLNNENSKAVFERAELLGVKFKILDKKELEIRRNLKEKNVISSYDNSSFEVKEIKAKPKKPAFSKLYKHVEENPDINAFKGF